MFELFCFSLMGFFHVTSEETVTQLHFQLASFFSSNWKIQQEHAADLGHMYHIISIISKWERLLL